MTNYLKTNRPKISIILVFILFISSILTTIIPKLYSILLLFPSNLHEPWNWYRLITYSLFVGGLKSWMYNSIVIILTGYIIESRVRKVETIGIILVSSIIGGLFYVIINQNDSLNSPIASPSMMSWGYLAAAIVIGLKSYRVLNLFERIVIILCFLSIFSLWNENRGIFIGQLGVIVIIVLIFFIRKSKINSAQSSRLPRQKD